MQISNTLQAPDGSTAYTRAGDLKMTANGLLTTAGFGQVANLLGGVLAWPDALTTT